MSPALQGYMITQSESTYAVDAKSELLVQFL